jgi:cell division protein FtsW (lipid II flippase)
MEYSIDFKEALSRVLKYLFEGLIVAFVALILPNNKLQWSEIWLLALTAACTFSVLDLLSPTVSNGARQGVGLGAGFQLVGFPGGF